MNRLLDQLWRGIGHESHVLHGWSMGTHGHVDQSGLQVGGLRHLGSLLMEAWFLWCLHGRFRDLLLVLLSDLALMVLNLNPSLPFHSRVLVNCFWLDNVSVIDLFFWLSGSPDWIKAPAAATFNEDTHCETMAHCESFTLEADEGEHHPSEEVVVDVKFAVR